jgi:tetratricopeptide (TPR) repeat protein
MILKCIRNGVVLFAAGLLDECEQACRECLRLDPTFVSAYVILGMTALHRNDDEKARRLLNQAVAMEPDNPFALNELSYLSHLDGDEDRAIELVNRAIAESPDYADALCNKGIIHYYRSEFEQAAQVFEQNCTDADHVGDPVAGQHVVQLIEFDEASRLYDLPWHRSGQSDDCHGKIMLFRCSVRRRGPLLAKTSGPPRR